MTTPRVPWPSLHGLPRVGAVAGPVASRDPVETLSASQLAWWLVSTGLMAYGSGYKELVKKISENYGVSKGSLNRALRVFNSPYRDQLGPAIMDGTLTVTEADRCAAEAAAQGLPVATPHERPLQPVQPRSLSQRRATKTELFTRAVTQIRSAVTVSRSIEWSAAPADVRPVLAKELRDARAVLSKIINQLERNNDEQ